MIMRVQARDMTFMSDLSGIFVDRYEPLPFPDGVIYNK